MNLFSPSLAILRHLRPTDTSAPPGFDPVLPPNSLSIPENHHFSPKTHQNLTIFALFPQKICKTLKVHRTFALAIRFLAKFHFAPREEMMQRPRYGLREISGLPRTEIFANFLRQLRPNLIRTSVLALKTN